MDLGSLSSCILNTAPVCFGCNFCKYTVETASLNQIRQFFFKPWLSFSQIRGRRHTVHTEINSGLFQKRTVRSFTLFLSNNQIHNTDLTQSNWGGRRIKIPPSQRAYPLINCSAPSNGASFTYCANLSCSVPALFQFEVTAPPAC